ncbi:MAG: hypothetical protein CNE99_01250 [OM182 bacterium MED-G24]|uniref:Fe2OG dioxygenase domain-containing protein n=1 Tax=OM182 bacterium MED-G24 TaxID=1986255 RepID=A0A2A5WYR9_9GAMM|nr:MAG: hypothetical protein CNE99_01250 [OM182 bacterium MED-G24]|tara:strand:- start:2328 stop:3074 length:747 start_codon:yes stop_codon:yes gene_type:complete
MGLSRILPRRLRAEVRLHQHNRQNRLGRVSQSAQSWYQITNIFPEALFEELRSSLANCPRLTRNEGAWRSGSALDGRSLMAGGGGLPLQYLSSNAFTSRIQGETGLSLTMVPEADVNRLSLLFYSGDPDRETGAVGVPRPDGCGWHVDGNIYLGQRWAGILTLKESTFDDVSKLELRPHGTTTTILRQGLENSLILFQGDHVSHRVRDLVSGEKRFVLSLLMSDNPIMTWNLWLRRYQRRVNRMFYGL